MTNSTNDKALSVASTENDKLSQATIQELDVTKLHTENLQLRNQQFILGTLALTGTGLAFWILPTAIGDIEVDVQSKYDFLLGAAVLLLVLLLFLLCWSMILRNIIVVISAYLKGEDKKDKVKLSEWEKWYSDFDTKNKEGSLVKRLFWGQTNFVSIAFLLYGVVVIFGNLLSGMIIFQVEKPTPWLNCFSNKVYVDEG